MNEVIEVPVEPSTALTPTTPGALLALAVRSGASIEQMERLMAMQVAWEKREAEKAFHRAFAAFKAEAVQIIKAKKITDGPLKGKYHAELADVVNAATPALSKHGLSTSWRLSKDERDWMEITCTVAHEAGHSESVSMGGAPDTGPGRNAIQARGSVKSYLERYTLTAILGLAAQDADDDGAGGAPANVQAGQLGDTWVLKARAASTVEALNATWTAGLAEINTARDRDAYDRFKAAVVKRQKEIAP